MKQRQTLLFFSICLFVAITACKKNISCGETMDPGNIDPGNFVTGIYNTYFPLIPGTKYQYVNKIVEGTDTTLEDIDVTVTGQIKHISGVSCEVIHDRVKERGIIMEDTYDYYAQDKCGNVWYFGEDTKKRVKGGWSTEGSWTAGVNSAQPGIIMYGNPGEHISKPYYQEYLKGAAEDQAEVLTTNSHVNVSYGTFTDCVETKEFSNLEPGVIENKYYARGIGQVLTVMIKGGNEREELINISH